MAGIIPDEADAKVAVLIIGEVNVLLVSVWVAARPTSVSVTAGSVSVLVPATAGASIVTDPDVAPLSFTGIRQYSMCCQKER